MTPNAMPLRDAIAIPETIHDADFVLQLHHAQEASLQTLRDYVVTESIAESFDSALSMVSSAFTTGRSKGAFIHGSFGSGKSHFMAVLHLLLEGNTDARALPGLQAEVAKHQDALSRNLFAIDYHLIGSESFESALFSGYLKAVKARHPNETPPVLHRSDKLFDDADGIRAAMGDEAFFAKFAAQDSSGWGSYAPALSPEMYNSARTKPPGDPERQQVAAELVNTYFSGYVDNAEWLDLSTGIEEMSRHAKSLGYEGIVLFLDELVLWLANHLSDSKFIQTETSKVAKLVETGTGTLPIPLISFVARQRSLTEFLRGNHVGAEQVQLQESFRWWEERFDKITLEAADLPQIVHKRLLQPSSEAGAKALTSAISKVRSDRVAFQHLLSNESGATHIDFELVYPFSPALVDAMVAISGIMQRERTALKIMSELLSRGRDELTVEDVIPVGDLFDIAVLGNSEPLTDSVKQQFRAARSFYQQKMRPYLLRKHGLSEPETKGLARSSGFRKDDRLAKTLLVAAIAPAATSLQDLKATKLAALNYGTVNPMIPGNEGVQVVALAREWATAFGEITVGQQAQDPVISFQLSGIDLDAVLNDAEHEDTREARRSLLRTIIANEIMAEKSAALGTEYTLSHVWRGQRRDVDVVFGNVRDSKSLPDSSLTSDTRWKLVVDFPFDDDGHQPQDDLLRINTLKQDGFVSNTIVWLPHFLTTARMDDVGKLVILEFLAASEQRFKQYASALPEQEHRAAYQQLTNQRSAIKAQIVSSLRQAYNIDASEDSNIGARVKDGNTFVTLASTFTPIKPDSATFSDTVNAVLGDALSSEFPNHPEPDGTDEIRRSEFELVLDLAREAAANGGRIDTIDRSKATKVRRVVDAYKVGTLKELTYVLDPSHFGWHDDFVKATSVEGQSIASLRKFLAPYGMTQDAENLLILAWAALTDRELTIHGSRVGPLPLSKLTNDVVLREPTLPDAEIWATALKRAKVLFAVGSNEHHLSNAAVQRTGQELVSSAKRREDSARKLKELLEMHHDVLGLTDTSPRLTTAQQSAQFAYRLARASAPLDAVIALAEADLPEELAPVARHLESAPEVAKSLEDANWSILNSLLTLAGESGSDAALLDLREVAQKEELHANMAPALAKAVNVATQILTSKHANPSPPTELAPSPPTELVPSTQIIDSSESIDQLAQELRRELGRNEYGKTITVAWRWND